MTKTSYLLLDYRIIGPPPSAGGGDFVQGPHVTGIFDSAKAAFAAGSKHAKVIEVCEVVRKEDEPPPPLEGYQKCLETWGR